MAGAPEGKTYAWRLCGWGARPGLDPPSPLSESQCTHIFAIRNTLQMDKEAALLTECEKRLRTVLGASPARTTRGLSSFLNVSTSDLTEPTLRNY